MATVAYRVTEKDWRNWEEKFGPIRAYMHDLGINWEDAVSASIEQWSTSVQMEIRVETYRVVHTGSGENYVKGDYTFSYTPPVHLWKNDL